MTKSNEIRSTHSECDSVFFKLKNKRRLAELLFVTSRKLRELTDGTDRYSEFLQPKKDGGSRKIEAPDGDLKRLQARISDLLSRIAPPEFLFAPVKGRSYVDNAARHLGGRQFHKLDIENFYPSCTANRVAWFFGTRMQCSPDITAMLVRLTTRNEHLPQGSPCSPILAYFSYVDMWHRINKRAKESGVKTGIYVDDIEVSGEKFSGALIWDIKSIVLTFGFHLRDDKEASAIDQPVVITGAVVDGDEIRLPNSQYKKIRELILRRKAMRKVMEGDETLKSTKRQLAGRYAQARQVLKANDH